VDRRQLLALLTVGLAAVVTGGRDEHRTGESSTKPVALPNPGPSPSQSPLVLPSNTPTPTPTPTPTHAGPPFDAAQRAVLTSAPGPTQQIALTIDDGYDAATVAAYVEFARSTGTHITFSPNGVYDSVWTPHAATLKPLIARGQVQIGNHTFHHNDLTKMTTSQIQQELETNEAWIVKTFGTTSRPFMRPPYGTRNQATDAACAGSGYTKIVMWNGSFGDSAVLTPEQLMDEARKWLNPGTIMLGHANHTTVTKVYDQILALIKSRSLTPVTLDEMFGNLRAR